MQNKLITYSEAINKALFYSMEKDKNLICYGLGITDPKNIFSTTTGLEKRFGKKRIFDVPTSENALTGISIGAALNGTRSVVCHQRLDFFLLAMDQLVNSAAKWYYMFGSQISVPITIRLIIGRGWGQGPTHSQNLQAWFNHIPGLKIVMPTSPEDAYNLLIASIFDSNPVIFLEHRWLHESKGLVTQQIKKLNNFGCKKIRSGKDITILSMSYLTIEAIKAAEYLKKNFDIDVEVLDIRVIKPLDLKTILRSVAKTKRLILLDTGSETGSVANDIISKICGKFFKSLKIPPINLSMPNIPEPTSYELTKNFYLNAATISKKILNIFGIKKKIYLKSQNSHDIPGDWFKGPF
jgi:pyruvate dehydrogenase E1 component beta subunit